MTILNRSLAAVRRSYDWMIAQIGAHPAAVFWLIVAYVAVRR